MKSKEWLIKTILIVFIFNTPFIAIASFNFFVDPLWNFKHSHKYNARQHGFDERQLKTNKITGNSFHADTLIIGTSRTSYINQNDFLGHQAFNYSVSAMNIDEYYDYIEYAKQVNGKPFDYIFMEVFFNSFNIEREIGYQNPRVYIQAANEPFYKIKSLFSFDTYERAKTNFYSSLYNENRFNGNRIYNRKNVAYANIVDDATRRKNSKNQLKNLQFYKETKYDPEYTRILENIRDNNPETVIVPFIPPFSSERISYELSDPINIEMYEEWIEDIVQVFGGYMDFMYINSITVNEENYYDSHHFYPHVGALMAYKMINYYNPAVPQDFGILVNQDNYKKHINYVKEQILEIN